MRLAANDKLIENSQNISHLSESFIYTYYKLKALLASNPQIETVYLGAGYHSFAAYYDIYTCKEGVLGRYLYLLPPKEQFRLIRKSEEPAKYFAANGSRFSAGDIALGIIFHNLGHEELGFAALYYVADVSIATAAACGRVDHLPGCNGVF